VAALLDGISEYYYNMLYHVELKISGGDEQGESKRTLAPRSSEKKLLHLRELCGFADQVRIPNISSVKQQGEIAPILAVEFDQVWSEP
jgi:hypothetical protein